MHIVLQVQLHLLIDWVLILINGNRVFQRCKNWRCYLFSNDFRNDEVTSYVTIELQAQMSSL